MSFPRRLVLSPLIRLVKERKWMRNTTNVCLTPWIVCSLSPMKDCSSIWKNAWLPWRTRQGLYTCIHLSSSSYWRCYCPTEQMNMQCSTCSTQTHRFVLTWFDDFFRLELPDSGPWELPETAWRIPPHQGTRTWINHLEWITENYNCVLTSNLYYPNLKWNVT